MEQKNQKIGYLFLAPLTIIVAVFLLYPFVKGFILSFFETKYGFGSMSFSGLKNFISIVKEEKFGVAIKNSMIWVVFGLILNTVFPMGIAILINRDFVGKKVCMGRYAYFVDDSSSGFFNDVEMVVRTSVRYSQ